MTDRLALASPAEPHHGADHIVSLSEAEPVSRPPAPLQNMHAGPALVAVVLAFPLRSTKIVALARLGPAPPPPCRNSPLLI